MSQRQSYSKQLNRREMLKHGLYCTIALSLPSFLWLPGCTKKRVKKKPNIFLITIDTLRADYLGCYDSHQYTSPNIDRFAKEALLFENCYSHAPVTSSSCASILSGFLPHETSVFSNLPLPAPVETLPMMLKQHGYKSIAVVSNYVLRKRMGWSKGFMIYDDILPDSEQVRHLPEKVAENATDSAVNLLKKFKKDQLFMWIHYQDPHGPYTPPYKFSQEFFNAVQMPWGLPLNRTESGRGGIPYYQMLGDNRDFNYYVSQYKAEIRYVDENFNRLIDAIKEVGLYENSLIIFTSDHGEGMGEHDYYFAHGENLYNILTHVPLIIKYGKVLKGRRADCVQHLDIVPTIRNIAGMKVDSRYRGRDLRFQLKTNREIFAEMETDTLVDGVKFSLTFDDHKLIYTPFYKKYQFFDLKNDPYEEYNLVNDNKYRHDVKNFKERLNRIQSENLIGQKIVNQPLDFSEEEKAKLRSLGYL